MGALLKPIQIQAKIQRARDFREAHFLPRRQFETTIVISETPIFSVVHGYYSSS